jgi:hypothetical protein
MAIVAAFAKTPAVAVIPGPWRLFTFIKVS